MSASWNKIENLNDIPDPIGMIKTFAACAPIAVQVYNSKGYSVYANQLHTNVFGAPPPPEYCVFEDNLVKGAGWMDLVHKAFGGENAMLPVFWYDPRNLSTGDTEYTKKFGKRCAIETHMTPVFDKNKRVSHVMFLFRDVTGEMFMKEEKEKALKERDDAKVLIQSVLDQTEAVIYIKNKDGKYAFVNGQFSRIFNRQSADVLGKTDYDLFSKKAADLFRNNDSHVMETGAHSEIEEEVVHADGTTHTYLSLKFPLKDSAGEIYGLCGISSDMTRHRQMERELGVAKRMESLGLLSGGIAHEFNNCLGIILMVSETLLLEKVAPPDWRVSVQSIKNSAQGAAVLIRQLLAFGRRHIFNPVVIEIGPTILSMANILKNVVGEDVKFNLDIGSSLWPVQADPMQIEQILVNLCFNSRDAMPQGGSLTIGVKNTRADNKDFVELFVRDNGTGIEPSICDKIFEPFFTTKQESQGSGLGLSTVYGIVKSLQGDISVESEVGKGASFHILIPRSEAKAQSFHSKSINTDELKGHETLLLVEDRTDLREVTAKLLRGYGYVVFEAEDGKSALQMWPKISEKVDLIVTDIVMPEINGLEMIKKMCLDDKKKVLFVSAYSNKKLSDYGFDLRSYHLFNKPFTATDFLAKVRELLETN